MTNSNQAASFLALDVGERRVGVATASTVARIARPLVTLENNDTFFTNLQKLIGEERAIGLVVGLPRGLDGQHTAQTTYVESFAQKLQTQIDLPLYWQDEAVTSHLAKAELADRGKSYAKSEIDALAATYILEDFLKDHPEIVA